MSKLELGDVRNVLRRTLNDEAKERLIEIELLRLLEEKELAREDKEPAVKKQWVIVVSDPMGLITTDLVGWVLQIPEAGDPGKVLEAVSQLAYDYGKTKAGRRLPAQTVGEAMEVIKGKQIGLWVKTREPIRVIRTDNKLRPVEDGAYEVDLGLYADKRQTVMQFGDGPTPAGAAAVDTAEVSAGLEADLKRHRELSPALDAALERACPPAQAEAADAEVVEAARIVNAAAASAAAGDDGPMASKRVEDAARKLVRTIKAHGVDVTFEHGGKSVTVKGQRNTEMSQFAKDLAQSAHAAGPEAVAGVHKMLDDFAAKARGRADRGASAAGEQGVSNPWENGQVVNGVKITWCSAEERIAAVDSSFDADRLRNCLSWPGTQKAVRDAIERRLRRLARDFPGSVEPDQGPFPREARLMEAAQALAQNRNATLKGGRS